MAPAEIVPRWEWRTFAESLAALERKVGTVASVAPRESRETYFLYLAGSQNAKLRDDQMDIKELQKVDHNGLELWKPVFKAKFPLKPADVAACFAIWKLPVPKLNRPSYTVEQVVAELVKPEPSLRVAEVIKHRRGFTYAGCIAEFVQVTVDTVIRDSFSLEHENPALINAARRELSLDRTENVSYPVGLKRALGVAA